jgi:hypothetical protein
MLLAKCSSKCSWQDRGQRLNKRQGVPARFVGTLFYVPQKPVCEAALGVDPLGIFQEAAKLGGVCERILSETAGADNGLADSGLIGASARGSSQHRRVKDKGGLSFKSVALRF